MVLPAGERMSAPDAAGAERLFFRTAAGGAQGWGNVVRLATFAHHCRAASGARCLFFAEGPGEVQGFLRAQGLEVVPLPEGVSLAQERALFEPHGRADVLLVEQLDVSSARQRLWRACAERLVVFDDLCDHVYEADWVVCGQDLPSHANRALSDPRTRFLVGYDHFVLRPGLAAWAGRERVHAETPRRVLVTLGGGRYDVAYRKVALGLAPLEGALEATFVLGWDGRPDLEEELRRALPGATVLGAVDDLERHLWECDVAVVGAGYTKLEAAFLRTPQVVLATQWHQIPLASVFAARTGVTDLGYMSYLEPEALTAALHALWPRAQRERLAQRAAAVVDGRGLERVHGALFRRSA